MEQYKCEEMGGTRRVQLKGFYNFKDFLSCFYYLTTLQEQKPCHLRGLLGTSCKEPNVGG